MGRVRKEAGELIRPRQVIAPAQPVPSRPRRSTKDAFYNKLSTLTSTKKVDIKEEAYEYSPKSKTKKIIKRTTSSSNADEPSSSKPRPTLVHQKREPKREPKRESTVLRIPMKSTPSSTINGLHHFLPDLRQPQLQLVDLNIETIPIDPRMQFTCDLCSRRFPLLKELEIHLGTHVENITSCSLCDKPATPYSMEEYTQHVSSHFIKEGNDATCIFCGEITNGKRATELTQHLLYFCPSVTYCFICDSEIERDGANQHRREKHAKLMNRYVCTTCFLGFPSLSPFLSHICDMRYRCLCEMTDVFDDHYTINQHIDECDEIELRYHGILIPLKDGRKRCFFVNPHSIMPPSQNTPKSYGFYANTIHPIDAGDSARKITNEMKKELFIKAPELQRNSRTGPRIRYPAIYRDIVMNEQNSFIEGSMSSSRYGSAKYEDELNINDFDSLPPNIQPYVKVFPRPRLNVVHLPQHSGLLNLHGPRIIVPRPNASANGPKMFTRLLKPVTPQLNIETDVGSPENNKEISSTKRVSGEENEVVAAKRMRISSSAEPETITS